MPTGHYAAVTKREQCVMIAMLFKVQFLFTQRTPDTGRKIVVTETCERIS